MGVGNPWRVYSARCMASIISLRLVPGYEWVESVFPPCLHRHVMR